MVRGRARRRLDGWLIAAMAVLLVGSGGPSLLLPDLDVHVVLGIGLALATSAHLWLHRTQALMWLPARRAVRQPRTARRRLVQGQDAGREVAFALTALSGLVLLAGGAGETLHLVTGFALVLLATVHAALHRAWFARRLRRPAVVSPRPGARP